MRFVVDTDRHEIECPDGSTLSWFGDGRQLLGDWWLAASWETRSSYGVRWRNRPVIQLPEDLLNLHQLIHRIRPTVIIETGVAHGGSLLFHASQLNLVHAASLAPARPSDEAVRPIVIGVELDMQAANRVALDTDPLGASITIVDGDSADPAVVDAVKDLLDPNAVVLVILDSAHTRHHVAAELAAYAPLVTPGSALVVMDTILPALAGLPGGRSGWKDDHPEAAIAEFLRTTPGASFRVDPVLPTGPVTHFPGGVLLRDDED